MHYGSFFESDRNPYSCNLIVLFRTAYLIDQAFLPGVPCDEAVFLLYKGKQTIIDPFGIIQTSSSTGYGIGSGGNDSVCSWCKNRAIYHQEYICGPQRMISWMD